MFKEILKINFSELENIIKNPSQFLQQEYNLDLSNNQIYFTVIAIMLFIVGISSKCLNQRKKFLIVIYQIIDYKSNEIASNLIIQKIDLANAYINMGKKGRAKSIIERTRKK